LAFVGDVYAQGVLADRLAEDPTGFVGPFSDVLTGADLAIGSLESAVAVGGRAEPKQYTFRAPPAILDALAAGGLDVVTMANNHGMDFGEEGLEETLAAKQAGAPVALVG